MTRELIPSDIENVRLEQRHFRWLAYSIRAIEWDMLENKDYMNRVAERWVRQIEHQPGNFKKDIFIRAVVEGVI